MRAPGHFCKAGARYFCARRAAFVKRGRAIFAHARQAAFVKQGRAIFARARRVALQSSGALFLRTPAGSFCKAGVRFFARARRVVLQSRDAPFAPDGPPLFPVCPPSARVHPPPAAAHTPSRLSDPCARPLSPGHGSVSSAPACPPPRAPALLFVLPRPHAPALPSVFSVSPARPRHHPLFHTVRPAAAPVSPCAAPPFPSPFLIQRASIAKENAVRTNAARRAASLPAPPV